MKDRIEELKDLYEEMTRSLTILRANNNYLTSKQQEKLLSEYSLKRLDVKYQLLELMQEQERRQKAI